MIKFEMQFCRLFSQLPTMFAHNKESQVVLGPVVKAGLEALKVQYNFYCKFGSIGL